MLQCGVVPGWRFRGGFWAGAAHPRRQKHREMPPPGASAPAFAATVEPLSNHCGVRPHAEHPRQDTSSTRDERVLGGDVLRMRAEDRLIRASILDFRAKLENRCKVLPVYALLRASILDFRAKLENRCSTIVVAVKNGSHAAAVAATRFRVRFYSSLPQRKTVSPAAAVATTDFRSRF